MKGTVKNKLARHNLCYSDVAQEPYYEYGRGRIIDFASVPLLGSIKNQLCELFGEKAADLKAEGNHYFNNKCGIGYHGDGERERVIAIRLGAAMSLCHQSQPVGEKITINLNGGDIYVMSEKAVGTDWLKRNRYTLRHAAGSDKYTTVKKKNKY